MRNHTAEIEKYKERIVEVIARMEKAKGAMEHLREKIVNTRREWEEYQAKHGEVEIVKTGIVKIEEAQSMWDKTYKEIGELLIRLPQALTAFRASWTTRTEKEVNNAMKKGLEVIGRVEGTKKKEIVNGKEKETGVNSLIGIIERKLASWSKVTRDWVANPRILARNRGDDICQEALDIIIGSLLGDATGEMATLSEKSRAKGEVPGCIIKFLQGACHSEYIQWLHSRLAAVGFSKNEPLKKLIMKQKAYTYDRSSFKERIQEYYSFRTFSFTSLHWIVEGFYEEIGGERIKVVPKWIGQYLTPRALAVWIMDDGSNSVAGVRLCTNGFTLEGVQLLGKALSDNFGLEWTHQSGGVPGEYIIYIKKASKAKLRELVTPFMHPSMLYKVSDKGGARGEEEKWRQE